MNIAAIARRARRPMSRSISIGQIPPPGRSRAHGTPRDALSQLGRVVVVVLLVTLALAIIVSPFD